MKNSGIKKETENLILAAQEQAIRTNLIKAKIDKTQEDSRCRMGGEVNETIHHLISECSKMEQKEYKNRHEPESVVEIDTCKVLWDITIQTDHVI